MKSHVHPSDLLAIARLATTATSGLTDIVQRMHYNISPLSRYLGIPGMTYGSIKVISGLISKGLDTSLGPLLGNLMQDKASPERDVVVAALNGVIGDHLAREKNPLAIPMSLRYRGQTLPLDKAGLKKALPKPGPHVLLMVHGLCMSDLQWQWKGHHHGEWLQGKTGYLPLCLKYNSGRHIFENGRDMSRLLEQFVREYPHKIRDMAILGHSMGGLVTRSALYHAQAEGHRWPGLVSQIFFVGTPHHGAPLERGGNWLETLLGQVPYAGPLARLGRLRSAGITDLRYGNLLETDRDEADRFAPKGDLRTIVPLPDRIACYAIAGTLSNVNEKQESLPGDGLVPVYSALGHHHKEHKSLHFPKDRQWIAYGHQHLDLMGSPQVAERIAEWMGYK